MTFEEWWNTYLYLGDDLDKELAKEAWEAGYTQACKTGAEVEEAIQAQFDAGWQAAMEQINVADNQTLAALKHKGYVLVPVEPTEKMVEAGDALWDHHCTSIYEAMLKAAQE